MSRSVWCSAYSNSYTYTQFSGKTGVLMASPIYVKVKSEFSLKKKGKYTGRELHGHTVSVTPLGPERAVPDDGRPSCHGLS